MLKKTVTIPLANNAWDIHQPDDVAIRADIRPDIRPNLRPDPDPAPRVACKPFLKWVGGKTQLLPQLIARSPKQFERYFEPFIGGGALFFRLQPQPAFISDINPELINCYTVVRDDVHGLIKDLSQHIYEKEYYYALRNADRSAEFAQWPATRRASRLLYLNKTCFNGLYRVNAAGQFNVPIGRYRNPKILDEKNLLACSQALRHTQITQAEFTAIEQTAQKDDFVYFDPPYAPISETSDFTSYTKQGFDSAMQKTLSQLCETLNQQGVKFMVSNSNAPLVLDLYQEFNITFVEASRTINSKSAKRGKIKEVLITNYRR